MPDNLIGTGVCLDSFCRIKSGSLTAVYVNYDPVEFPANIPIWRNGSAGSEGPPVVITVSYNCAYDTWSFQIGDNSHQPVPAAYGEQGISRPGGYTSPQNTAISGNACGAADDGNGAYNGSVFWGNPNCPCPQGSEVTGTFTITVNNNTDCCYDADAPGGPACLADIGAPCPSPDCSDGGG